MAKKYNRTKVMTVEEILKTAAGTNDLPQAYIEVSYRMKVSPFTMKHWRYRGIPQEHWGFFIQGKYATAEELVAANEVAKKNSRAN